MTKPELILIGAGGHARSCIDVIELGDKYQIAGLVDAQISDESGQGYPVLGTDQDLTDLAKQYKYALIAVGQILSAKTRIRLFSQAATAGFQFPTIISPNAYVSKNAQIGSGTIVMHGAVVNANARIGQNCIINSRSLIEHDVEVADHCHISTASVVNGGVRIGSGTFMGSGCVVKEYVTIGAGCIVGMGQIVLNDLADSTQMKGPQQK